MDRGSIDWLPVAASFALVAAATPAVRALARRFGFVARPKADRWHNKPTALLGGVPIFAAVLAVSLALVPGTGPTRMVLAASAFLFLVGLVDDLVQLKPYQKLIGQVMGASLVLSQGLVLPWTGSALVNIAVTLVWLVGITNAINLLDNMDGLAAGVAAIASGFLALNFAGAGQQSDALLLAVFGASLVGFLIYNSNPATIFMGDCGSLFIGFFLASTALLHPSGGRSRSFLPVIAVPVLTLFIPIFDTFFVIILRSLAGRPISRGGRDHTSHRLVALGLSERRAVWMLYGLAATSGVLALVVRELELDVSLTAVIVFTLALTMVGVHLAGVKVYDEAELGASRDKPVVSFLIDLTYKRRVFEVLLDVVLIALAYYSAYSLVNGPIRDHASRQWFLTAVPLLLVVKLGTFLALGVYRGVWRYVSLDDLIVFAEATLVGSVAGMVLLLLPANRFTGFSRSVVVLDGLFLFVLLSGSRLSFRVIRRLLPSITAGRRRVLIYGAGDAGELLLRELINNRGLGCEPVGFADDDPRKKGKVIHGLRVFGGNGTLPRICVEQRVDEVLISSSRFSDERVREIARVCDEAGIALRRMLIRIERLNEIEAVRP